MMKVRKDEYIAVSKYMSLRLLTSTHCAKLLTVIVAQSLLVSCTRKAYRDNEISKIEIAVSGPLPNMEMALSIDSSHSYHYYGNKKISRQDITKAK